MENLISLIHKIERAYTALADQGLDSALPTDWDELPSIAVVGGQSSGKSSVLEMIIGKDCIPKGKGMATRRPLVLQLHRIDGTREYAQFLHQPGKTYRSSAEVRKEIADETCRETGLSKPISSVPIHLSIFAQNVVNLTLIDLPGLSKTAADGQSNSIGEEIESIARSFIEKSSCIILAVCPADQDLTTSDTIKIACELDPKGERTFGILTKLDLMPEGTHAVDVLEGKICRLQYPWIGVVNQSQDDMDMDMGIDLIAARRRELEYFGSIPEYKHLAHRMGSQHLVRALAKHFVSVLKTKLPYDYLFSGSSISSEASKKNCLQTYSLRAYGTPPIYQLCVEGEGHKMTFQCGVKVSGKVYWSAKGHSHSKHAEEEAACVACTALMGNESMETLFALIEKGSICKVMLLSQYALKKGLGAPLYGSSRVAAECQLTQWLSTVSLDGRIFIGDAANKKRASLQSAAFAAVQSLLEDGDDMMLKVVLSKSVKVKVPRKKKPKSNCASVIKSNGASIKNIGKKRKLIVESLVAESEESDAS